MRGGKYSVLSHFAIDLALLTLGLVGINSWLNSLLSIFDNVTVFTNGALSAFI